VERHGGRLAGSRAGAGCHRVAAERQHRREPLPRREAAEKHGAAKSRRPQNKKGKAVKKKANAARKAQQEDAPIAPAVLRANLDAPDDASVTITTEPDTPAKGYRLGFQSSSGHGSSNWSDAVVPGEATRRRPSSTPSSSVITTPRRTPAFSTSAAASTGSATSWFTSA
jgi:hypothetical protein